MELIMVTKFFVSDEPDTLSRPVDDEHQDPPPYDSAEEAIEAIRADEHGTIGRKYVLRAELSVVAEADRGWELTRHGVS
jgi:hypothetical protein